MFPHMTLVSGTSVAQIDPHQYARVSGDFPCRLSMQAGVTVVRHSKNEGQHGAASSRRASRCGEPNQYSPHRGLDRRCPVIEAALACRPRIAVTTATRLAKGISLLGRERFDLVLLDLSLPDGDGVEAVCRVHRAARDVPIIGLSTVHDEEMEIPALREGAQDWLVKGEIRPFAADAGHPLRM